ncbi:TPA: tail fiber assembly protein [Enterobacter cloacae]
MTFKMSNEAQTVRVFNLNAETKEFIGAGDAWIPAYTGLPANCTDIEPPEAQDGEVAVFDFSTSTWNLIEDYRGATVFNTVTGEPMYIVELGALPEDATLTAPDGPYQKWNGNNWVDDEETMRLGYQSKLESERQALISEANIVTSDWRIELMLGSISDEDKARLSQWMGYIKELKTYNTSSVVDDKSYASFTWPLQP